ncbi:MAG TPA: chemotaxis protein CheW [Methanofollis liminatans]|uniref:Chemotaxis protein CheW n=1 Tax=Methanofollis liminatans TaxID=2201 RepID=A0A831LEP6_9EURY|nr:chemotaxis protein CheW [Methanofollis liminatans]
MSHLHLLLFTVERIVCALPLSGVRQVVGMVALQPGTGGHRGTSGTMNLHGRSVPVYSARVLLGLPDRPPLSTDSLIIASPGQDCVAFRVDRVKGVQESPVSLPAPSPSGVLLTEDGTVLIHDLAAFLAAGGEGVPLPPAAPAGPEAEEPPFDPERAGKLLQTRARALAQPEEEPHEAALSEILTFRLASREYAVETRYVREVFIIREITPVPGVPDFIAGICAVRGEIISVVDLRRRFSIPEEGLTDLNRVIVLTDGAMTFGILADYITDIGTTPTGDLAPVDPGSTPIGERYLLGVAEGSQIVLDAAAILADRGMVITEAGK